MKPLKVTFRLSHRMADPESPMHLDSLLAFVSVNRNKDKDDPYSYQELLPLDKESKNGVSVWKASALIFERKGVEVFAYTRRVNPHDIAKKRVVGDEGLISLGRKNKIDIQRGAFKQFQDFVPTIWPEQLVAYCIGDKNKIQDMLKDLTFLGKFSRMGLGRIKSVLVEDCAEAEEKWQERFLPWEKENYFPLTGRYCAPYWGAEQSVVYSPSDIW